VPNVNLSNVLVSALTSGFVALGVEWLAKPRLEARKERILRRHRAVGEIQRCLSSILVSAAKLQGSRMPKDLRGENRAAWLKEFREAEELVQASAKNLEDSLLDAALTLPSRIVRVLSVYRGFVTGVAISDKTMEEKGRLLNEHTAPILDALGGPSQTALYKVRVIHRGRRLRDAEKVLGLTAKETVPVTTNDT
jgi:hypothetical protein